VIYWKCSKTQWKTALTSCQLSTDRPNIHITVILKNQSNSCSIWPPLALTTACSPGLHWSMARSISLWLSLVQHGRSSLSGCLSRWCCPGKPTAAAHPTRHSPLGWVQIRLFAGHKAGSMKSGTFRCRNSISVRQQVRFLGLKTLIWWSCQAMRCTELRDIPLSFSISLGLSQSLDHFLGCRWDRQRGQCWPLSWQSEVDHCLVYGTLTTSVTVDFRQQHPNRRSWPLLIWKLPQNSFSSPSFFFL